jgi:hypothetical protein
MREYLELRVSEDHAGEVFSATEGKLLSAGFTHRVTVPSTDPRLAKIGELQKLYRAKRHMFFAGWEYHRRYSPQELSSAELFHLMITAVFEPAGKFCGTVYDKSNICKGFFREHEYTIQGHKMRDVWYCGAGAKQVSDLILDLRKVPKGKDIARTVANEWIVSQRLAEILTDAKMTGFDLRQVKHKGYYGGDGPVDLRRYPSGKELLRRAVAAGVTYKSGDFDIWLAQPDQKQLWNQAVQEQIAAKEERERLNPHRVAAWYQLVIASPPVPVAIPPTRLGIDPFDEDLEGRFRCPFGHVAGYALLSEITVPRGAWEGSDIARTQQMTGYCWPVPLLLLSPRLWRLLHDNNIKGYKVEVAYIA